MRIVRVVLGLILLVVGVGAAGLLVLDIVGQVNQLASNRSRPAEVAGGRALLPQPLPAHVDKLGELAPEPDEDELQAEPPPIIAEPLAPKPITRLVLPRIALETEVVPAPFIVQGNEGNWDVPPYKAGHAEYTAGAGQPGNAILLGHVTSLTLGNVFETLDRARPGDVIHVGSGDEEYAYEVIEIRRVSRTDVSVLDPEDAPVVTLITCTGIWLPHIRDYSERLVVKGQLIS